MRLTENTRKNLRLQLLGIWGTLSILACGAEEMPGHSVNGTSHAGLWFMAGAASLLLCFCVGRILKRKGLLPDVEPAEEEEEEW